MGINNKGQSDLLKGEESGLLLRAASFPEEEKINYFLIGPPFDKMLSQQKSLSQYNFTQHTWR